jgi:hypothetical protein
VNILARKPRAMYQEAGSDHLIELILVDRGADHSTRYVVGTADAQSLQNNEWYWGHYFSTLDAATLYFNTKL